MLEFTLNSRPHEGQGQRNGVAPVWVLTCMRRLLGRLNRLAHVGQTCFLLPVTTKSDSGSTSRSGSSSVPVSRGEMERSAIEDVGGGSGKRSAAERLGGGEVQL